MSNQSGDKQLTSDSTMYNCGSFRWKKGLMGSQYTMWNSLVCCLVVVAASAREYPGMNFQETDPNVGDQCFRKPRCDFKSKYRTIDGSCNNVKNPIWGKVDTPLVRLLPARYRDGFDKLPQSKKGGHLPNARNVSDALFKDVDNPLKYYSMAVSVWGQAVAHDGSFALFPNPTKPPTCCPRGKASESASCADIEISTTDPFYSQFNRTCMPILRTKSTRNIGCKIKPIQQLSSSTHLLDLNIVYGSATQQANSLRTRKLGHLKTSTTHGEQFCPHGPKAQCDPRSKVCYSAGDLRINQNLDLAALQTVFLREHNRLATGLHAINPSWNDERLYQEARRILIAEYQYISYYEFLPLLIGGAFYDRRMSRTEYTEYNPHVNPSTINEFTTGCYRYFHTLLQGMQQFIKEDGTLNQEVPMEEWFFRPDLIEDDFDGKLVGFTREPAQGADDYFTNAVHQFHEKRTKPFGDDLEAIDIQRGREHGLGSYSQLREACGEPKAQAFSDFETLIDKEYVEKIAALYESPEDVDIFVGTLFEKKKPLSLIGPTCDCVIREQFHRWKAGDRFWFEHRGQVGSFTKEQLDEISNTSLARLLCDNTEIDRIQHYAFWQVQEGNEVIYCKNISSISLEPWKSS